MTSDEATRLTELLDKMRAAILAGNLGALAPLGRAAEQLLAEPVPMTQAEAMALREKAAQNLACLAAAGRGIRAAQRRLVEVREAVTGVMSVYDAHGHRAACAAATSLIQRL